MPLAFQPVRTPPAGHNNSSGIRGIARECDYGHQTVLAYLNVFKLPEKYQDLVWAREIPIGVIGKIGTLFDRGGRYRPEVYDILEKASSLKHFGQREAEEAVKPYLEKGRQKQIEEAKKVLEKVEPEVKEPETPEEFGRAAKALMERAEELKSPEEKAEEKKRKLVDQARKSLNASKEKIDSESKIIDVNSFRKRLNDLETSLEQNPAEVREQLIALGKEV